MNYKDFGKDLEERLKKIGLSQAKLAQKIGASKSTISGWKAGESFPDKTLYENLIEEGIFKREELEKYKEKDIANTILSDFILQLSSDPYSKSKFDISTNEKQYEFLDELFIANPCAFSRFRKSDITEEDLNVIFLANEPDEPDFSYFASKINYTKEKARIINKFGIDFSKLIYYYYKIVPCDYPGQSWSYENLKNNNLMEMVNSCLYYHPYIENDFLEYYKEKTGKSFFKSYNVDGEEIEAYDYIYKFDYLLDEIENKKYRFSPNDIKVLKLADKMGLLSVSEKCDQIVIAFNEIFKGLHGLSDMKKVYPLIPGEDARKIIDLIEPYAINADYYYNKNLSASCIRLSKKGKTFLKILKEWK